MWHAGYQIYPLPKATDPLEGPVRRRHVIYIQGLFPRGPSYYHHLLAKNLQIHADLYGLDITCSPLSPVEPYLVRCEISAKNENHSVHTTYDFFDWQDIGTRAYQRGLLTRIIDTFYSFYVTFADGAVWRMLACRWKYVFGWIFPYILFATMGVLLFLALRQIVNLAIEGITLSRLLWVLADVAMLFGCWGLNRAYWLSVLLCNFNYITAYMKGSDFGFDKRLDLFADYIVQTYRQSDADEIVVVGHSFGTALAIMAMERAVRRGPLNKDGPRIKLVTVGDMVCYVGFLRGPGAFQLRQSTLALARQKDVPWLLLYSGKDIICFDSTDTPSAFSVIDEPPGQPLNSFNWPLLYDAVFRRAIKPKNYHRFRWRFFHTHSQFIMAAQLKTAHWDYMRVVCGGEPLSLSGKRFEDPAHA